MGNCYAKYYTYDEIIKPNHIYHCVYCKRYFNKIQRLKKHKCNFF